MIGSSLVILTWKKATTRSATQRLTMKRCIGALCLRLRSRTHSTKLLLSVVSARTRLRMPISACASATSRTLTASGALVVPAELFWRSQKYDPPPYEPFSPMFSREVDEEMFHAGIVWSDPCQPDSSASSSMPLGDTIFMFVGLLRWCKNQLRLGILKYKNIKICEA